MDGEKIIKDDESFLYYEDGLINSPEIVKELISMKNKECSFTNLTCPWPKNLIPDGVGEVKIWEIYEGSIDKLIFDHISNRITELFPKFKTGNYVVDFQITEWQPGSFIPWHRDLNHTCALTCYLDDKTEYGGEFLCKPFEDQTMGMLLEPVVDRAVLVRGVMHSVAKIHSGSRTTLQIWFKEKT